ncbi:hypothetical protein INT47_009077 [Mucor saturninus]|uniref:NodB homology domain-containing protein n=1 Tax=Mucor saturninus TaxID=64648 RepID=A0A8H7RKY3_9FUNG|nr:hypothetical protein INT47_009077 [Mucor saturninus]
MVKLSLFIAITTAVASLSSAYPSKHTSTSSGILAVSSPSFLPNFPYRGCNALSPVPTGPIKSKANFRASSYPQPWVAPDVNHPEVQKAIKAIDWSYVPKFEPRVMGMEYDEETDPACWWTNTQCTTPRVDYLPEDVKFCPNPRDFGLTYDDGPLPPRGPNDPWGEPRLYDFLAKQGQTATLFYVGSNVVNFPQAAIRAIESGHTLCAHTWSHPQMTTISNAAVVAQLYWSMRAIKEAAGVTTRCWRPPYGDIDDRVRAIAHQMGLSTILWNSDSFDWGLPSIANDFAGAYREADIDAFFQSWIDSGDSGTEGRIVLEHETSNVTVLTSEKWLPRLKKAFNVKKVHDCAPQLPSPYWET